MLPELIIFILFLIPLLIIWRLKSAKRKLKYDLYRNTNPALFNFVKNRFPEKCHDYLIQHDKYYTKLSRDLRKIYLERVLDFILTKRFETRKGLQLTEEMMFSIASAAIKVTFGLQEYLFPSFHTIIIYPDEFTSGIADKQVTGETHGKGVIVFSWRDLKYGASIPDDAINLGYHEFAHALFLEHLLSREENTFKNYYRKWVSYIKTHATLKEVKRKKIFHEYASTNEIEFFAVALENFFERPSYFKRSLPELYEMMTLILNQDPTY
jgi:MtfA peptidase